MKIVLSAIAVAATATIMLAPVSCSDEAVAISGCCKHRSDGRWYKKHGNFDQCKRENAPEQDNVFRKSGKVWWDTSC